MDCSRCLQAALGHILYTRNTSCLHTNTMLTQPHTHTHTRPSPCTTLLHIVAPLIPYLSWTALHGSCSHGRCLGRHPSPPWQIVVTRETELQHSSSFCLCTRGSLVMYANRPATPLHLPHSPAAPETAAAPVLIPRPCPEESCEETLAATFSPC